VSADRSHQDPLNPPEQPEQERVGSPIPPSIELAWGLRDPGARGPKRGLTLARIVEAGIEIARAEGLDALSMARVANELGVGTMSLYRYVAAKDELLTLMVDTALGAPDKPPGVDENWRTGLAWWATAVREAYRLHPWSLKVPITAPPLGPNNVAWLEAALESLASTRLSEQQKLSVVLLVSGFVRNEATLTADIAAAAGEQVMPGYGAVLAQLIAAGDFPALYRAIGSGALDDDDDLDSEFAFGLERILDGVEVLIARTRSGRRR
jgi:AcrR family transcriptional regulator